MKAKIESSILLGKKGNYNIGIPKNSVALVAETNMPRDISNGRLYSILIIPLKTYQENKATDVIEFRRRFGTTFKIVPGVFSGAVSKAVASINVNK